VDYQYYINEANKIIHDVDGTNDRLLEEVKLKREEEKIKKEEKRALEVKEKEEIMFKKYCLSEKGPTEKQVTRYSRDWLVEKYGEIKNVR